MVDAQLAEQLLLTSKVRGSNAIFLKCLFAVNCVEKTKIKIERPGKAHLKTINKTNELIFQLLIWQGASTFKGPKSLSQTANVSYF